MVLAGVTLWSRNPSACILVPFEVLVKMIDVLQHVDDILLGLEDAVEAPLPPRFSRNIPDMTVKVFAFCRAITTFSAVTTGASWSRPPSSWTEGA